MSVQWFTGAETNLAFNCLDRHVEAGLGDRVAFFWEGNDLGEDSTTTYRALLGQARSQTCASGTVAEAGPVSGAQKQGTRGVQSHAVRLSRLPCYREWIEGSPQAGNVPW